MSAWLPIPRLARFGQFEADLATGELRRRGVQVALQPQPFKVLAMLLERAGDLVTRDELRQALWPDSVFVDFEHGLNRAIHRLRIALGDLADSARYVETLEGRGYRFLAPVELADRGVRARVPGGPSKPAAWVVYEARAFALKEGPNRLGRDPGASIFIADVSVSREHATITIDRENAVLLDLDSRNGSFVNNVRAIGPVALSDGDRVRLGGSTIVFRRAVSDVPTATVDETGGRPRAGDER